jgi:hypothetical protein
MAYTSVSRRLEVMQDGETTYAFAYKRNRSKNADFLRYKFLYKGDTISGSTEKRDYINIGDSILIMYNKKNPRRNIFIHDTLISDLDMFLYKIYN